MVNLEGVYVTKYVWCNYKYSYFYTIESLKTMNKLYEITTLDKLYNAFQEVKKVCPWKKNIQLYEANLLLNLVKLQKSLRNGTYKQLKGNKFTLHERGKTRHISSPQIQDRIVQKVLNKYVLIPELRKYLIYDNYASLKNRGTSFARKRHLILLRKYLNKYSRNGYILQIDIHKYFDNIDHQILIKMLESKIKYKEIYHLLEYIINNASNTDKGLNLGSETPQISAILYLGYIDTYCKNVLGIKYYGRYMDDIFILDNDKNRLKSILKEIRHKLKDIKLEINEKKTQIINLKHKYTYLQTNYIIKENLQIIRRPTSSKILREKRKLKQYRKLLNNNRMNKIDIQNSYKSWKYSILKNYNYNIKTMDSYFSKIILSK